MNQDKPFLRQPVLWQSVISLALYPVLTLPGRIGLELDINIATVLVIIYFLGIVVTTFWSLTHFLNGIFQKNFSWKNVLPLIFSGISLYILYAMTYGLRPFPPLSS